MANSKDRFNKNILIAVDDSDNARRAVDYVGQLVGGYPEFKVLLMHVIPEPEEDYFQDSEEKDRWIAQHEQRMTDCLLGYRRLLLECGFSEQDVDYRITRRFCPSMAKCILSERDTSRYDTIVVGRQGLSRREEFLFGSISSKIVTHASGCTVWVVE